MTVVLRSIMKPAKGSEHDGWESNDLTIIGEARRRRRKSSMERKEDLWRILPHAETYLCVGGGGEGLMKRKEGKKMGRERSSRIVVNGLKRR